jgi:predicted GH43/DUF377 family glycosyl hydrolase
MKNKAIFLFFLFLAFIISSCGKESVTDNPAVNSGAVSMRINKTNAPSSVTQVMAYLTQGQKTLSGSLNLKSDSTANINFSDVLTGQWHLRIDALNASGTTLYTGESDLTVEENKTTSVSLTLQPVKGAATGCVIIEVNWGNTNTYITCVDNDNNPIFTAADSPTNPQSGVYVQSVIYDQGKYQMWYTNNYQANLYDVGYSESADGIKWNSKTNSSVFKGSANSNWDMYAVTLGTVIKDSSKYKMYYGGSNDASFHFNIGLATSSDGMSWTRRNAPIYYPKGTELMVPYDIVVKDGTYYMFFAFYDKYYSDPYCKIGLATSKDGINWTKYSTSPIISASASWEGVAINASSIIYDKGRYVMLYSNQDGTGFGLAYSTDLINWSKYAGNPIMTPADTHNQWASNIYDSRLIKTGNEYKIYYAATSYSRNGFSIGVAIIKNM